jgi:hypothetical protein
MLAGLNGERTIVGGSNERAQIAEVKAPSFGPVGESVILHFGIFSIKNQ